MVSFNKARTRTIVKDMCEKIDTKSRQIAENKLLAHVQPLLDKATSIAVYHAYGFELSLSKVIDYALTHQKELFVPISYRNSQEMLLTKYDKACTDIFMSDLVVPANSTRKWYNLDLILLPLVAVNNRGVRLGKGGGYYDVTLADIIGLDKRPILCGVGYDCQLLDSMPVDSWDICLDYFASEKELKKFK